MQPEVRIYADRLEGLNAQLTQLRGLIKLVPPLIEADRQKRWDEIGSRPSDGEEGDVIDIYSEEAGPEEGYGFAEFDHTIYVAAVVTAWAAFHDFLARELRASCLQYDLSEASALATLVEDEVRNWDRRFDDLVRRYSDFAGVGLRQLSAWDEVHHALELRNALVHNQGQYTQKYLKTRLAHRPTEEEPYGFSARTDDELINREVIPLSLGLVDGVITQLLAAATEIRGALNTKRNA